MYLGLSYMVWLCVTCLAFHSRMRLPGALVCYFIRTGPEKYTSSQLFASRPFFKTPSLPMRTRQLHKRWLADKHIKQIVELHASVLLLSCPCCTSFHAMQAGRCTSTNRVPERLGGSNRLDTGNTDRRSVRVQSTAQKACYVHSMFMQWHTCLSLLGSSTAAIAATDGQPQARRRASLT